ncbi:MAG: NAD(P)H-hydrate dehydratase [Alphaproteobacteria bacterium]|nr:NAD(P)H-hydrate dehydratase [Alphaproteobacteria bacterium]
MLSAVLTNAEMARADALAEAAGSPVDALMRAAGCAVATVVMARFPRGRVLVLCGPGNNGGDGYVAAAALRARGRSVTAASLGDPPPATGAAGRAAQRWDARIPRADAGSIVDCDIVVDALFGAGLSRPLAGEALALVEALARSGKPVVAIDVPSGLDGDSGLVRGAAAPASATVTFFRKKPGHLLLPGRDLCGDLILTDIGLPDSILPAIDPATAENHPALWRNALPRSATADHKFRRGHALVVGGAALTGAAQLAARAALRAGAGLVTIVAPGPASTIHRAGEPAVMVEALDGGRGLAAHLDDPRRRAILVGPGNGRGGETRDWTQAALATGRPVVLDADALSVAGEAPARLFGAIRGPVVMTPHEGEFARLFDVAGDKLSRARQAAAISGAVVLLKGADTVVAHPDGRAVVNANAPPSLATAGSGDVLAGIVVGLLARGVGAFDAACAAAWLHGEAAQGFGPGLIASDLPAALRDALAVVSALDPKSS